MQGIQPSFFRQGKRWNQKRRRWLCAAGALLCCVFLAPALFPCWSEDTGGNGLDKASLAQADHLLKEGKPQQAISLLLPLVEKQPVLPGVEARLGKAYYETRDLSS